MKASIEVESRREAELIRIGLDNPEVRAFVIIAGALTPLSKRTQQRVLAFVKDHFEELEVKESAP